MCQRLYRIRSVSPAGAQKAFVPCGKCEECRQVLKNSWSFRLRCELETAKKNGWHIGFFTLTYAPEHLPHLPTDFLKAGFGLTCFNREHVRNFIDNIRKKLNKDYGVSGLKYMICAEYGSTDYTHRPHYHGLIVWPRQVPSTVVFDLIGRYWPYGHRFPRYIDGGLDSHGYSHKPFEVVGDIGGAATYAAKYCCKDLNYQAEINRCCVDPKDKALRRYGTFHIQSRSLGWSYLESLDAKSVYNALRDGISFLGTNKRLRLPLYLRNKFLFQTDYKFVRCPSGDWWFDFEDSKWRYKKGAGTHTRLVRRKPTKFFEDNFEFIYRNKVKTYESLFERMQEPSYWQSLGVDSSKISESLAQRLSAQMQSTGMTPRRLAEGFLSYYGVDSERCYCVPMARQWYSRFVPHAFKHTPIVNDVYRSNLSLISSYVLDATKFCVTKDVEQLKRIAAVADFHKSREY